ncbi:unnamed protein product [Caenorhabditis brenneri]
MTLPFQKLPFLVMKSIFETMAFLDLFMLSCTSAKTKRIVKTVFKIRNHWLLVVVGEPLSLQIVSGTDENYKEEISFTSKNSIEWILNLVVHEFHLNIGAVENVSSNYIEEKDDTFTLLTYWSDPKTGFNVFYDALFEVFGAKVGEVEIAVDEIPVKNYQKEIDWIENRFPPLATFRIIGRCSFQNYIWLMKNVRARNIVFFTLEPTEYPENHEVVNLEMEEIRITHGRWMKMQDIQAIKARSIVIWDELDLEFYREADPGIVLEGLNAIDVEPMSEDCLGQWSIELANGKKCTILYAEYETNQPDIKHFVFEIRNED